VSTALSELKVTELKSTDIALVAADAAIVTISSVDFWAPPKLVPATTESALFNLKVPAGPDINDAPPGGMATSSTEVAEAIRATIAPTDAAAIPAPKGPAIKDPPNILAIAVPITFFFNIPDRAVIPAKVP
jgi:hypothetical protein